MPIVQEFFGDSQDMIMQAAHTRAREQDECITRRPWAAVAFDEEHGQILPVASDGIHHVYCKWCAFLWCFVMRGTPDYAKPTMGEPWCRRDDFNDHAMSASHRAAEAVEKSHHFPWVKFTKSNYEFVNNVQREGVPWKRVYCSLCAELDSVERRAWQDTEGGHVLVDENELLEHSWDAAHVDAFEKNDLDRRWGPRVSA